MTTQRLRLDQFIEFNGVVYQLKRAVTRASDGAKAYQLENPDTGEVVTISVPEYEEGFCLGTIRRTDDPRKALDPNTRALLKADYGAVPESMRKAAERMLPYVQAFYERCVPSKSKKVLTTFIRQRAAEIDDAMPPAWNTLCRYLAKWERVGKEDIRLLLPNFHKRGPSDSLLPPMVRDKLRDLVNDVYLNERQNKAKHVHAALHRFIKAENEKRSPDEQILCPTLRTVQRFISDVDQYTRALKRRGKKYADHHFKPVMEGPQAERIMEVVEVDHTKVDLIVVDDNTGVELGRPWITVLLDRYSRCVIGFHIGFEPPSILSTVLALRHAMTPKAYVRKQYPEVRSEYPCWGIPDLVLSDNGPEFESGSYKEAALTLGFKVEYAPVDCPEFKGKVERFFRTANENVAHRVPGTSNPRIKSRADAKAAGEPSMPFNIFVARFHRWLVDVYHLSLHDGIDEVPLNLWKQSSARMAPRQPHSVEDLAVLCLTDLAPLTRKGIRWRGLCWNGPAIKDIRVLPTFKSGDKVRFRIDPLNVHTVHVIHPVTGEALPVGPADAKFRDGVTLFQWERARKLAKARAQGAVNNATIIEALDDLRIQADQLLSRKQGFHLNRIARFKGIRMRTDGTEPPAEAAVAMASKETADKSDPGAIRLTAPTPSPSTDASAVETPLPKPAWPTKTMRKTDSKGNGDSP
ncbi:hypothetical protein ACJ41P_24490 [Azospirillum argentinense]|uniref:Integrase catalytic domain-containing protein n=1 Tax=Azospirillum argentinense TaxID=2970906 RepID=A0ABW8VD75_9PROT